MSKNKSASKKYESESDSFDDEPIPRKKNKPTNESINKKNDDKNENKRLSQDKKLATQAFPRKETRSSHNERKNDNSSQKGKSVSQDPKSKTKLQQKLANKKGVVDKNEKSKPSTDQSKLKKPINAKRSRSEENESVKDKGKNDKHQDSKKKNDKNEKQEKNDKRDKSQKNEKHEKHEKKDERDRRADRRNKEEERVSVEKEKEEKRQTRSDKTQEAKDQKKLQNKQQTEKEKQMAEFTRKYPQYLLRGKFKFPIEDRLFDLYSSILEEHLPTIKRPTAKSGFIPAKDMGDILQIWNFFQSFPELFKFEDIEKEEIYAGLKYSGEESLGLLNDMHQGILSLYLLEFIKKNRFETSRDEIDHPFFVLIKYQTGNITQNGDELAVIWTEFANKLAGISPYSDHYSETLKRYFENLATKTCLHYNKLEYRQKIKILLNLIEGIYDTDVFRDFLQSKTDNTSNLIKERNDLTNELKQDEIEYTALKAKLTQAQKGVKKADSFRGNSSTRLESLRRPRNAADTGKQDAIQRYVDELNILEELINKKQETLDTINSELVMTLQTATFVGVDGDKTEYWVFQAEPDRLYIRNPSIMSTDEEWFYYNTKEDILTLIDSLNPKGIKEGELQEKLLDLIEDGILIFDEDELEEEQEEEEQKPKRRGRPKKKTEEEIAAEEAEKLTKSGNKKEKMELEDEEDDDDDGYVVRKKETVEAKKNKESETQEQPKEEEKTGTEMNIENPENPENAEIVEAKSEEKIGEGNGEGDKIVEEPPVAAANTEEQEKQKEKEKIEAEETKVNNEKAAVKAEHEKELARLKELEIEREREQERIREKERIREERLQRMQRKIQEANSELGFDYWFAKVIEYQAPPETEELVKATTETETAPVVAAENPNGGENPNEPQAADKHVPPVNAPKLTSKKKSPQDMTLDFIKRMLLETEEYLSVYLVRWEARWAHPDIRKELVQNLKDAKTIEELRPVLLKLNEFFQYSETPRGRRGRPVRNKSTEREGEGEEAGEGDMEEEEEDEEEKDKSDWGSKRSDEEMAELDEGEKANPERENPSEEKSEIKPEKEEGAQDQKESATKSQTTPGTKTQQVKKMPLKFWGAFTARLKKSWVSYTTEANNMCAIYFATMLLCETVNNYVEKKNIKYFTKYKTGKEYVAAKKLEKEEAYEKRAEAEHAAAELIYEIKKPVPVPNTQYFDRNRNNRNRGPVTRGYRYNDNRYVEEEDSQKSSTESDSMVSRLRKRTRRPPKFPDEIYTHRPSKAEQKAKLREQQQRLEELAGLRRSTRIGNQIRKKYTSVDEQQWQNDCKVCRKQDGEMLTCTNCSESFHPDCIGYDMTVPVPAEGFTCEPCIQHIASSRQTRSSSRRVQI